MKVVIVGARKRSEAEDEPLVNKLVDGLIKKYPMLRVVSASCDRGVGKIVKSKCLPDNMGPKPPAQFNFIEIHVRPYLVDSEFTAAEFADIFTARNAMLAEIGEEFHLFVEEDGPRGMMLDLYNRVKSRNAPCAIYKPGDKEPKPASVLMAKAAGAN